MRISNLFVKTAKVIDSANTLLGRVAALFAVVLIILTVGIVVFRLLFNVNSLAAQEAMTYAHAALFMLCLGVGIIESQHVRVDIFYQRFSLLTKAWIDAIGAIIFLLPFSLFLLVISWEFAARSWHILETSSDTGGLAFVYLLKTLIPVTGMLLVLQAVSECIKNTLTLYYLPKNNVDTPFKSSNIKTQNTTKANEHA